MSEPSNVPVVRRLLLASNRGDVEAFLDCLHPDVECRPCACSSTLVVGATHARAQWPAHLSRKVPPGQRSWRKIPLPLA